MSTQLSVHNVTRISARATVEFLPQKRGERGFWTRTLLLWQGSEIVEVLVFGATEAALTLPGEKPAEARLDAYADQARKTYTPPTLTEYTLPEAEGGVDLAAEAAPIDSDPYAPGKEIIREGSPEHEEWIASLLPDIDPTAPM